MELKEIFDLEKTSPNSKVVSATLRDIAHLFPNLFFHRVGGGGDKAFLRSDDGYCVVIPIAECCPIQILSTEALMQDLDEFGKQLEAEGNKQLLEIENRKKKIKEVRDELDSK